MTKKNYGKIEPYFPEHTIAVITADIGIIVVGT